MGGSKVHGGSWTVPRRFIGGRKVVQSSKATSSPSPPLFSVAIKKRVHEPPLFQGMVFFWLPCPALSQKRLGVSAIRCARFKQMWLDFAVPRFKPILDWHMEFPSQVWNQYWHVDLALLMFKLILYWPRGLCLAEVCALAGGVGRGRVFVTTLDWPWSSASGPCQFFSSSVFFGGPAAIRPGDFEPSSRERRGSLCVGSFDCFVPHSGSAKRNKLARFQETDWVVEGSRCRNQCRQVVCGTSLHRSAAIISQC